MTDVRPARAMRARLIALWLTLLLAISVAPARASGTTWLVDRPGDDATDGDLGAHLGTVRCTLAHATSGDLVNIGDVGADKIFVSNTLTVPAGVAVGGRRDQSDCGSYKTPLAVIEESPPYSLDTIVRLEAG